MIFATSKTTSENKFSSSMKKAWSKFTSIFHHKKNKDVSTKTGGKAKAFLSKLSGAFLLPISVLSIAGLFLGIGATIAGQSGDNEGLKTFGLFIKNLGQPVFTVLPLLFASAVAISFTEEAGVAVFSTIIGYVTFILIQSVFINPVYPMIPSTDGTIQYDTSKILGYKVLFEGGLRDYASLKSLVGNDLGIQSLQTSVFGGISIGLVIQYVYGKFHTIKLPQIIAFFGGKRFVPIMTIIFMIPLAFLFLLIWPYIGYAFNWIGLNSGKIPYGFDSFIFGYVERILVPFGLHHVFYSPLWYTSAGGNVFAELQQWQYNGGVILDNSPITFNDLANTLQYGNVVGDSSTTVALVGLTGNNVIFKSPEGIEKELPVYSFIADQLGIKLGRFMQGKFSFMEFGLPAAGVAMIMAAPKENRKAALGTVLPAMITSFVTGVTEPIEFTFLFLSPFLFFGFHAFMCALSFLLANLLGCHIGMTFSGGFMDLIIYGMIPVLKGTEFWWTLVVGIFYPFIYFPMFYFWIKKQDLPTPGRGGNTKLFTKKDYQASKSGDQSSQASQGEKAIKIIEGYGGIENITKTANCASRLRFDVVDASKVSEEKLKEAGAFGVRITSPTHVQAIFGPAAEQIRIEIDKTINDIKENKS